MREEGESRPSSRARLTASVRLGQTPFEGIRAKYEELSAELARWESLARSTAFKT